MKSVKANEILPDELLIELQKYVQGETLYIPKAKKNYRKWGSLSGGRKAIDERNASLKSKFNLGQTIDQLADEYFLSTETIKKIVYSKNN
ncbi:CD3324 family protein [Chengkuizengella axinellae]|uniref:CD3324 family protein n=1 Tax=Chengkuizengella axinellae TaxID=3064388 RepID=A0ABT9J580_9BACL|nr:CD3324 family protein [Chengkuizengella sp. 2205SS18-9]MDP5276777.1 CD3324 family protein [Chengkuizengella sp. 2205SS18-9]